MAEFQSERGKLPVILMVLSYFNSLSCGISFLWFKRVLESEQYDAVGVVKEGKGCAWERQN